MIYILGTTHDIQYGDNLKKARRLYRAVNQMIVDLKITVLAEEVNSLNFQNPDHWMLIKELALKHGIDHIQCEPDIDERAEYGLEEVESIAKCAEILNSDDLTAEEKKPFQDITDNNSDKREQIWFDKIKNRKDANIIFVVGWGHISKSPISRGRGLDTVLAENGWNYALLPYYI